VDQDEYDYGRRTGSRQNAAQSAGADERERQLATSAEAGKQLAQLLLVALAFAALATLLTLASPALLGGPVLFVCSYLFKAANAKLGLRDVYGAALLAFLAYLLLACVWVLLLLLVPSVGVQLKQLGYDNLSAWTEFFQEPITLGTGVLWQPVAIVLGALVLRHKLGAVYVAGTAGFFKAVVASALLLVASVGAAIQVFLVLPGGHPEDLWIGHAVWVTFFAFAGGALGALVVRTLDTTPAPGVRRSFAGAFDAALASWFVAGGCAVAVASPGFATRAVARALARIVRGSLDERSLTALFAALPSFLWLQVLVWVALALMLSLTLGRGYRGARGSLRAGLVAAVTTIALTGAALGALTLVISAKA
jgi:hypothetical protein